MYLCELAVMLCDMHVVQWAHGLCGLAVSQKEKPGKHIPLGASRK